MSKELKEKAETGLEVYDYGQDAGSGFENQTDADIAIPFIYVLQSNSDAVQSEKANSGQIYNNVTGEFSDEVIFVPATTQHVFVEWIPIDDGGGFVGIHQLNSDVVKKAKEESTEFGRYKTPEGNDLIETFYVYGVTCQGEEATGMGCIAFTSTKISVYKRWNTKLKMFQINSGGRKICPPLFAHLTKMTTIKESKGKYNWHNAVLSPANGSVKESLLSPQDPRFQAAKECKEMVESGLVRADFDNQEQVSPAPASQEIPDDVF